MDPESHVCPSTTCKDLKCQQRSSEPSSSVNIPDKNLSNCGVLEAKVFLSTKRSTGNKIGIATMQNSMEVP